MEKYVNGRQQGSYNLTTDLVTYPDLDLGWWY